MADQVEEIMGFKAVESGPEVEQVGGNVCLAAVSGYVSDDGDSIIMDPLGMLSDDEISEEELARQRQIKAKERELLEKERCLAEERSKLRLKYLNPVKSKEGSVEKLEKDRLMKLQLERRQSQASRRAAKLEKEEARLRELERSLDEKQRKLEAEAKRLKELHEALRQEREIKLKIQELSSLNQSDEEQGSPLGSQTALTDINVKFTSTSEAQPSSSTRNDSSPAPVRSSLELGLPLRFRNYVWNEEEMDYKVWRRILCLELAVYDCLFLIDSNVQPLYDYSQSELECKKNAVMAYILSNLPQHYQSMLGDNNSPSKMLRELDNSIAPPSYLVERETLKERSHRAEAAVSANLDGPSGEHKRKATFAEGRDKAKKPKGQCYRCGFSGHWIAECPHPSRACYTCKAYGHIASECTKSAPKPKKDGASKKKRGCRGGKWKNRNPAQAMLGQQQQQQKSVRRFETMEQVAAASAGNSWEGFDYEGYYDSSLDSFDDRMEYQLRD